MTRKVKIAPGQKVHRPRETKRPANRQLREFEGECEFYLHPALFNQQPDPEPMFQRAA